MPPALLPGVLPIEHIRQISRSISSSALHLLPRVADLSEPPLASVFALVIRHASSLSSRATASISDGNSGALITRDVSTAALFSTAPLSLSQRQSPILVIPTTYRGLNAGPPPGTVVGVTLGAIAGFVLCFYVLLSLFRFTGIGKTTIIEREEIHHHRSPKKRSRSASQHVTEVRSVHEVEEIRRSPPRRRESRRDTVIVEETIERDPSEVIVEEEEDDEEDIVEVIEEHSPEPPRRRERRSGYRTVDPAEFGGGSGPRRKVNKR